MSGHVRYKAYCFWEQEIRWYPNQTTNAWQRNICCRTLPLGHDNINLFFIKPKFLLMIYYWSVIYKKKHQEFHFQNCSPISTPFKTSLKFNINDYTTNGDEK